MNESPYENGYKDGQLEERQYVKLALGVLRMAVRQAFEAQESNPSLDAEDMVLDAIDRLDEKLKT